MLKIDLHSHSFPLPYIQRLQQLYPGEIKLREAPGAGLLASWVNRPLPSVPIWEQERRLQEIERDSVTIEVLSSPLAYTFVDKRSPELCRIMNDSLAEACRQAPDRLRAFAHLPFNDMDAALRELTRAVDELGFPGVLVSSNIAGRYPHTPEFWPFWEEVNRRKLPVFLHPAEPPQNFDDERATLLEFPFDTTRSVMKLLYAGLFERCPEVVLIVSHLGGTLPFLARRIDQAYEMPTFPERYKQIKQPPSEYMRMLYLDIALGWHKPAFDCACQLVGIDRIVYGSDHFMPKNPVRPWTNAFIDSLDLPPLDKEKVYGRTAEQLLQL